jgi:hypothetical protein
MKRPGWKIYKGGEIFYQILYVSGNMALALLRASFVDTLSPLKTLRMQDDNINCMSSLSRNFHKDYVPANSLRATALVAPFIF